MKISAEIIRAIALKMLTGLAIAILLCGSANAQSSGNAPGAAQTQGPVTQRNLSLPMAKTIAEVTLATCQAKGYHTAVAVVDRAGQVMVILRDEQANALHVEMARRKAYTAKMFRMTTAEFQKRATDPNYTGQKDLPDILALGGGVPIQLGSETIGGVASAGSTQEQDDACAKAGIAKVADLLK
jgi:uncharacterized protein GlcG (DUF336 family)